MVRISEMIFKVNSFIQVFMKSNDFRSKAIYESSHYVVEISIKRKRSLELVNHEMPLIDETQVH